MSVTAHKTFCLKLSKGSIFLIAVVGCQSFESRALEIKGVHSKLLMIDKFGEKFIYPGKYGYAAHKGKNNRYQFAQAALCSNYFNYCFR